MTARKPSNLCSSLDSTSKERTPDGHESDDGGIHSPRHDSIGQTN